MRHAPGESRGAGSTNGFATYHAPPSAGGPPRGSGRAEAERRARAARRAPLGNAYGLEDEVPGDGVTQFQYDARNTGVAGSDSPNAIDERWSTQLLPGVNGGLAVADGSVYVAGRRTVDALDAADGSERWSVDVGHSYQGVPATDGDAVYVTTWNGGDDQERGVVALDADDGSELWRAVPDVDVSVSPTVADGTVYVGGSIDSEALVAIDAADGAVQWEFTAGQYATTPAVADGVVYVGGGSEHVVYAVDADTGEELWRFEAEDRVWGAPTVADGLVHVTSRDGQVTALSAASGEPEWSASVGEDASESVAVADDAVYVPADESLVALTRDGEQQWSVELSDPHAPTVAGDAVVLTDRYELYCLDRADGTEHWSMELPDYVEDGAVYVGTRTPPVVADGSVYAAAHGGEVLALDPAE